MINVGIVGSTGYGGCELVRFLLTHPNVHIEWVSSRTYSDQEYSDVYKGYFTLLDQKCVDENLEKYLDNVDVVFFATPQGVCAKMVNENVLKKVKVIDLSADYRIKDVETYESWYGIKHASPEFIQEAVYGLCEINREDVKNARLIANPGCYPTCSILSIYPLAKAGLIDMKSVIVDAKSGTSGAGRGAKVANLYCEVNESIKAYGVATHRHTPEIEEQLSYASGQEAVINFTPHLVPMNRGILVTAYANLVKDVTEEEIRKIELLLKQAHASLEDRKVVPASLQKEKETEGPAAALELTDGRMIFGKTSELLGASSALLLNALKELAGIPHENHVISPEAIRPIQELKTQYLGSKNPRLHTDETLIALSVSAANNPEARKALEQLPSLRGCQAHTSVMLSSVDIWEFRKLGIELTCEPKFEKEKIYH